MNLVESLGNTGLIDLQYYWDRNHLANKSL